MDLTPWNIYFFLAGLVGWFTVGVMWKDRAIMLIHLVALGGDDCGLGKQYHLIEKQHTVETKSPPRLNNQNAGGVIFVPMKGARPFCFGYSPPPNWWT
jgi:hypothetical protein